MYIVVCTTSKSRERMPTRNKHSPVGQEALAGKPWLGPRTRLDGPGDLGIRPEPECFDSGHVANPDPLLDEGLASAAAIDTTCRLGLGYPDGPIERVMRGGLAHHHDVSRALFDAGAGRIGNYTSCSFRSPGTGTFFGEEGTKPAVGQSGKLETSEEMPPAVQVYRILRNFGEAGLLQRFAAVLVGRAKAWNIDRHTTPDQKRRYVTDQADAVRRALAVPELEALVQGGLDLGVDPRDALLVALAAGADRVEPVTQLAELVLGSVELLLRRLGVRRPGCAQREHEQTGDQCQSPCRMHRAARRPVGCGGRTWPRRHREGAAYHAVLHLHSAG